MNANPTSGYGATGPAFGVIDHNTFYNSNVGVYVADVENTDGYTWGSTAWGRPFAAGTTDSVVIEDNLFTTDGEISPNVNNNNPMLYGTCGGRATFRHNTHTATGSGDVTSIDAHGEYAPASGLGSTAMYEVYENIFSFVTGSQVFTLRGGKHIWWNNTITTSHGASHIELWDELNQPFDDESIQDSYFSNNVFNGSVESGPLPLNPTYPYQGHVGTNYWMQLPAPGQTFYPYTPLVYPHPLVTP